MFNCFKNAAQFEAENVFALESRSLTSDAHQFSRLETNSFPPQSNWISFINSRDQKRYASRKGLKNIQNIFSRFSGKFFTFSWLNRFCFEYKLSNYRSCNSVSLLSSGIEGTWDFWTLDSLKPINRVWNVFAINNLVSRRMKLIFQRRCCCRPSFCHASVWDLTQLINWRMLRYDNWDV